MPEPERRGAVTLGMGNAPSVEIRDAAQAMQLAEEHGRIGERYIICSASSPPRAPLHRPFGKR